MVPAEIITNIRKIEIRTRKIVDELTGGAYHSVFKGRGMEFSEVREYVPGDDVRAIDWNVTARFGHPYIKKFVEERELTVILVVDISSSDQFGSIGRAKSVLAAELAGLLAFSAIRNNDQVGLLRFSTYRELYVPPRKGRRHVLRLIRELLVDNNKSYQQTNLSLALETMMRLTNRRAVVFLISDMLDEHFAQALKIAGRRHDVIGMRITDPLEINIPAAGYLQVEDLETGAQTIAQTFSARSRQRYQLDAAGMRTSQAPLFRQAGVDLIDITSGQDYVKPLMQFFRKREKRR